MIHIDDWREGQSILPYNCGSWGMTRDGLDNYQTRLAEVKQNFTNSFYMETEPMTDKTLNTTTEEIIEQLNSGTYALGSYLIKSGGCGDELSVERNPHHKGSFLGDGIYLTESELITLSTLQTLLNSYRDIGRSTNRAEYSVYKLTGVATDDQKCEGSFY